MFRGALLLLSFSALLAGASFPQDEKPKASPRHRQPPPIAAEMQAPVQVTSVAMVAKDTEIRLRLMQPINRDTANVGDRAQFVLATDFFYRNALLAKAGTPVEATLVEASQAKFASHGSKLVVEITALQLDNGQRLPLRGYANTQGDGDPTANFVDVLKDIGRDCGLCDMVLLPAGMFSMLGSGALCVCRRGRRFRSRSTATSASRSDRDRQSPYRPLELWLGIQPRSLLQRYSVGSSRPQAQTRTRLASRVLPVRHQPSKEHGADLRRSRQRNPHHHHL